MLVDVSLESNQIENMVLGVGINFDIDAKKVEKLLKDTPNFYGVASLSEQKKKIKPVELIQAFLVEIEEIYESLNSRKTKKIISEWTKRSSTIGKKIEMNTIDETIKGKAIKIDEDGALIVSTGEKVRRIIAGDIVHKSK